MLRLDEAEVAQRASQARDPDYWRSLAPHLHVCDSATRLDSRPIDPAGLEQADTSLEKGAFQLRGVLPPASLAGANAAIDAVTAAGWPATFAFAYDELWLCARAPALVAVARRVLGASLENGCMHVVARDAAPRRLADRLGTDATLTGAEVQRLRHGVQALPALDTRLRAIAGGILGYGGIEPMLLRYEPPARRLWPGA